MISLKVLSAAAAMALVLPMAAPSMSFAQGLGGPKAHGAPGGGGGFKAGGGGGGGFKAGGGGGFHRGGGAPGPRFSGGGGGFRHGGGGHGWRFSGGGHHRHGGGFIPGAVAGAVIGGALASQSYGYYGGPGYYGQDYYDDGYYDDGVVAVVPVPAGGDAEAYCMQRFRSYDPRSGTYLGYDGKRHPCP